MPDWCRPRPIWDGRQPIKIKLARKLGLVDARPVGRASVYSLRQPALPGLLAAAEAVLDATGNAVALCPNYGQAR